jgi:hypothetical protein
MSLVFPRKLLLETSHDWNLVGNTATAGQTATSSVDIRSDGGGLWSASLNNIQFLDASYTKLWRAVRQLCNGGVNPIVVPCNDIAFVPAGQPQSFAAIPHGDGALFDDGAGYYQDVIDVTNAGGANLRATVMNLTLNNCGPLQGGELFSIRHPTFDWRMYEIGSVTPIDGTHVTVTFNPPLREAVNDGDAIEFDRPRCLMKLVNAAAMDLNITTWPFSVATVKFVESKYAAS